MKREFKFRAWDTVSNKYRTFIPFQKEWFDSNEWDDAHDDDAFVQYPNNPLWHTDRIVYEQYTGLKDKNGREIYEGDILWDGNDKICPSDGKPMPSADYPYNWWERAVVRYDENLARFVLDFYSPYGGEGYSGREQHIDEYVKYGDYVIGNIHENPELLK